MRLMISIDQRLTPQPRLERHPFLEGIQAWKKRYSGKRDQAPEI